MKIEFSSKNYNLDNRLKEIIEKKVKKLDKYFDDGADVKVNCKKENNIYKLELNIRNKGLFYRAEVSSDDIYNNIDLALPKVEKQIIKYGDKFESKFKRDSLKDKDFLFISEAPVKEKESIVKTKTYELEPISVEDAQMFLETIDNNFYVFLNRETGRVNVIYRRLDGNFGLIDTIV